MEKLTALTGVAVPLRRSNVDTDQIIPARFLKAVERKGFGDNLFRDWRFDKAGARVDGFPLNDSRFGGDILVAAKNFGCGSSREQAPEIIKALGISCVIAKSFARIFFRNSINNGLLLIEQPDLHDNVKEGDQVTVVMNEHVEHNGKQYPIASLPENLMDIIQAGGLVKAMRKLNGLD